ncbi:MAG TPA: LysM peptidoglycan-binding domain-containing M23 family metallopeptidase [Candidatus Dormibacteraeota bacterium]|nr:LysM peptidoglycan-binding domain-containing M23 family metallopeptidase [Candidatus Dormibacteraeota bacterium]
MRHARGREICAVLFVAACAAVATRCGGRASVRAVTGAEPPPITEWEHPARVAEVRPAVRLDGPNDRPSGDESDAGEGNAPLPERPTARFKPSGADLQIHLEPGMTLYSLARTYRLPLPTLMRRNGITDPTAIPAGTVIVIPGASSRTAPPAVPAGAPAPALMSIAWPIDGRVTGGFGLRGRHHHHDGIDIDGYRGEEVRAVAAGTVVVSGSEREYGKTVVLDHGNGVTTLYAHASKLLVHEGDRVEQGEVIAKVGATGNARGTHLHFEVRRNGKPVDPSPYLQSGSVPLATP